MTTALAFPIGVDNSQIGHARRQALSLATSIGLDELKRGQLSIIVTEAAANIAAHAGRGEIVIIPWRFRDHVGIDVVALDTGQGMADIGRSLEDGYSTAGTAGQGLGAISRLAGTLQIYSAPGQGTGLLARIVQESPSAIAVAREYLLGAVSLAVAGETQCGDEWDAEFTAGRSIYIVADGLGHGSLAAEAAREAIRVFREAPHLSPSRILADAHLALGKTRGAAVSIAEILHDKSVVNYAGIGNVSGMIYEMNKARNMVSMNGTLGHTVGKIQQFSYPWQSTSTLIMHSDGLGTRWNLEQYPGLSSRHPSLVAGVLYRDFHRKRDDVTILISRL